MLCLISWQTCHPQSVQALGAGVLSWSHLDRFSWLIMDGGGLTLSVPPGQKLLVIQVTFSSTTCTYNGEKEKAIELVFQELS